MASAATARSARVGFALAFACALVWSGYLVASRLVWREERKHRHFVPHVAVSGLAASLAFEGWVTPPSGRSRLALAGIGFGPIGAAFVLWDLVSRTGGLRQPAA